MSSPIFISYSHKDSKYLQMLQTTLIPFVESHGITPWDDTQIKPGDSWREEIKTALEAADVAVLLVSPDFLASDFIKNNELPPILDAQNKKRLTINWIAVRSSGYQNTLLERYQALGDPKKPLDGLSKPKREAELVRMCGIIASALKPKECPERNTPDTIEDDSNSAQKGFEALSELMVNQDVLYSVRTFRTVFGASCEQIETLGYYKDLHDLLHTLQLRCYKYLTNFVRMINTHQNDMSMWQLVDRYEETVQDIVEGFERAVEKSNLSSNVPWVSSLLLNFQKLIAAVSSKNAEEITKTIFPIKRVLATEPSILNARLNEAARSLPLRALVDALTRVRDELNAKNTDIDAGVIALNNIDNNLRLLRDEHNKWQIIDSIIRRIDGQILVDLGELQFSWAELKDLTEEICLGRDEEWATSIIEGVNKLDGAISNNDSTNTIQYFQIYQSLTSRRFYDVDTTLKRLCDELRKIGQALAAVWEKIDEH